jgi:DNA-binding NtrC family response regulator
MTSRFSLLICCKDESLFESMRACLSDPGSTLSAFRIDLAQKILETREAPILVVDLSVPGNIEALVSAARLLDSGAQVILLADPSEAELARRCLRLGAQEILPRPCDPELLRRATDRAVEAYNMGRQLKLWQSSAGGPEAAELLGSSMVMRAFSDRVAKLSAHDASVLITGEPGTGKSRMARLIHAQGPRRAGRFVALDCLDTPEGEQARRLFGDAVSGNPGALEAADGGTLYLHEVDALGAEAQESLQEALKEREFRRLGSQRRMRLDLRVISSASRRLRDAVYEGLFREDLYWSLCGVALEAPSLRERMGDIEELLRLFLDQACRSLSKKTPPIPATLLNAVRAHSFPGNISELKHLCGLLAALSENGEITLAALPAQVMTPLNMPRNAAPGILALKPIVHEFEKQFLLRTLKAVNGNQSKAARALDIHRNTLILKMQELGIPNRRRKEGQRVKRKA